MAEDFSGERTEKATAKRRAEARRKGQVAKSREIPSVMVLLIVLSVLFVLSSHIFLQLSGVMVQGFQKIETHSINPANLHGLGMETIWSLFRILSPVMAAGLVMALLSNYIQIGSIFSLEVLQPKFSKLNPLNGLKRVISKQSVVELLKSLFKFLIIGWAAYSVIRDELPHILTLMDRETMGVLQYIGSVSMRIFFRTLLVMVGLAALDYGFQRWSYEKSLRMTKREVQEEYKQTEGDPLIKSRIRSVQREMARKRMMAEVPKADVIVTNPTHLAVALRYSREEMMAPRLVAKGAGLIAEKIKEVAQAHQIPIVENKPLAQILFKTVDLGQLIPSTLYQAVADLLAYVYRMKNKVF
jgi:flagellar biosynthetic protein FlhB